MACFNPIFFDDSTIENPFKDTSVQDIVINTRNNIQCNYYDNQTESLLEPNSFKMSQENLDYDNVSKKSSKCNVETADLIRKHEELERRERELIQREQELTLSSINRQSNWPPLPEKCCFQPCFYQDIKIDIPTEFQRIVFSLYYLWIFHSFVLILNVIGGIILHDFHFIGEGLLYLMLFPPLSYVCWFRPAYKAFRSDSSFNFIIFFFIFFFQLIISSMHAIGATGCGTIGILTAIFTLNDSNVGTFSKIVVMFIAAGFVFAATADLYLISKIHRIYKNSGASLEKAQKEFAKDFLKTEYGNGVAGEVFQVNLSQLQRK